MVAHEAREFLGLLFGRLDPRKSGLVWWLLKRHTGGPRSVRWSNLLEIQPAALRWLDNTYVSVCTFRYRRKSELACCVPALWADIDPPGPLPPEELKAWQGQTRLRLLAFTPALSVPVFTGRGWQAYWLLINPVDLDPKNEQRDHLAALVVLANRALAARLDGDAVGDLARVMRVPGTVNTKTGRRCRLVVRDGPSYVFRDLLAALDVKDSNVPAPRERREARKDTKVPVTFETGPVSPRGRGRPRAGVTIRDLKTLSEWARSLVKGGVWRAGGRYRKPGKLDRSRADLAAVGAMVRAGWPNNKILAAFERDDWLIGTKYRELRDREGVDRAHRYLGVTIATARKNAEERGEMKCDSVSPRL